MKRPIYIALAALTLCIQCCTAPRYTTIKKQPPKSVRTDTVRTVTKKILVKKSPGWGNDTKTRSVSPARPIQNKKAPVIKNDTLKSLDEIAGLNSAESDAAIPDSVFQTTTKKAVTSLVKTIALPDTVRLDDTEMKQPIPDNTLSIWIYIWKGNVFSNRLLKMHYPGSVRKVSYKKDSDGVIRVLLESTFNPEVRWTLPLNNLSDGPHYVTAIINSNF